MASFLLKIFALFVLCMSLFAEARVSDEQWAPALFNSSLLPRADTAPSGSCSVNGVCSACKTGLSCSSSSKKRGLYEEQALEIGTGAYHEEDTLANVTSTLVKRVFQKVTQATVGDYLQQQATLPRAIGLTDTAANGSDLSFTRQYRFSDYVNRPSLIIGTEGGFLTGCSVLTIISRRAVYMGHFWQNLAYENTNPDDGDLPNFQENVLNLLGGTQPLYYATGTALDTSLFTEDEDLPFAFYMTPRFPYNTRRTGARVEFPGQQAELQAYLTMAIPNLQSFVTYGYVAAEDYPANEKYRGVSLFEFDPDADGQGNGNWRLFYEETFKDGQSLGQNVVGNNVPT